MNSILSAIYDLPDVTSKVTSGNISANFLDKSNKYFAEITKIDTTNNTKQSFKVDFAKLMSAVTQYAIDTVSAYSLGYSGQTEQQLSASILKQIYPVGSLYISFDNNANPKELLGFGTWLRIENRAIWCCGDNDVAGTSSAASIPVPEVSIDFRRRSNDDPENKKDLKDRSFEVPIDPSKDIQQDDIDSDVMVYSGFVRLNSDKLTMQYYNRSLLPKNIATYTDNTFGTNFMGLSCAYLKPFVEMKPEVTVKTDNTAYATNSNVFKPTSINAYVWKRTK